MRGERHASAIDEDNRPIAAVIGRSSVALLATKKAREAGGLPNSSASHTRTRTRAKDQAGKRVGQRPGGSLLVDGHNACVAIEFVNVSAVNERRMRVISPLTCHNACVVIEFVNASAVNERRMRVILPLTCQ